MVLTSFYRFKLHKTGLTSVKNGLNWVRLDKDWVKLG